LLAAEAVTPFDNTLAFIGDDSIVYRIAGTGAVQRVSNHAIERTIASDAAPAAIMASSHAVEGHAFAVFSGANWTRVFDAATEFWHSRESFRLGRWRARFPVKAWGKTIVGDELTGNLYFLDKDSFVEGDRGAVGPAAQSAGRDHGVGRRRQLSARLYRGRRLQAPRRDRRGRAHLARGQHRHRAVAGSGAQQSRRAEQFRAGCARKRHRQDRR
jgi:hypothetical protein